MATPNLSITLPTVGGSTDTWGATLNTGITAIDALFSISGTDVTMSDIKFNSMSVQETGAGTDTVKIQAPAAVTTSYTLTMPAAVGTINQVLSAADGSGTLAWTSPETGDITSVVAGAGMTGGGSSGAVTLNVIGTADKVTVSADAVTIASTYVGQTSITTLGTIATGTWQGTTVAVNQGGTGATSLTDGGVLLGSGTGAITATSVLGDGEILIGDASGDPATLDVGSSTAITILGTVATGVWQGTAVANTYVSDALTISGGSVDNSPIGAGTAAVGTFTQVDVEGQGDLRLQDTTGGQYVAFQAAGTTTSYTLTMPAAVPSANEVLTASDGSGTLSWAAPTVGDITGVTAGTGLSGGGTTGTVTLNVEAAQTQITSVGALGAGSITSGFGAIDVGSSNIDGGTITADTALVGTLSTAAQANITSVGTLSSLGVGDITSTGNFATTDTGPHSFGGAVSGVSRMQLGGAYTSDGSSSILMGLNMGGALTGASGDTTFLLGQYFANSIVTQTATEDIAVIAQAYFVEPAITDNLTGDITTAATVYIASAPSEGETNAGLYVNASSYLASRVDHATGATLSAQYGSGNDIGLNTSSATTDFNIKCVGEFAVSAGASSTTNFLIAGTAASFKGTLDVTSDLTTAADLVIGTNPSSAGTVRLPKNFGVKSRNQANDGDLLVMTENHVTGTGSLEFGDNSGSTWTDMRFHVSTGNVMVLTSTLIALNKATTMNNAAILMTGLATSDPGVAGQLWRSGNDVKISTG